jgi:K+-transporting ATPase ATPase C chain
MKNFLIIPLKMLLVFTLLTGVLYPLTMTFLAQQFFPHQANGSLIVQDGKVIGSELIGQKFQSDRYFHSRPSAVDYKPLPSGANNLAPTSKALSDAVKQRLEDFATSNLLSSNETIPTEMLFTSGSGVDPHISLEAALLQVNRIAQARGFDSEKKVTLVSLVHQMTELPQFGLFGQPRVNLLKLNLALDEVH